MGSRTIVIHHHKVPSLSVIEQRYNWCMKMNAKEHCFERFITLKTKGRHKRWKHTGNHYTKGKIRCPNIGGKAADTVFVNWQGVPICKNVF
jgi:hypothetical protein